MASCYFETESGPARAPEIRAEAAETCVMDFSKPQFQNSHLAQVTGLSSDTLQTWANRGLLTSSTPGRVGSGQRRLYSAADVIHVCLLQKLMAFGLPVSVASEMCSVKLDDIILESIYPGNDRILM